MITKEQIQRGSSYLIKLASSSLDPYMASRFKDYNWSKNPAFYIGLKNQGYTNAYPDGAGNIALQKGKTWHTWDHETSGLHSNGSKPTRYMEPEEAFYSINKLKPTYKYQPTGYDQLEDEYMYQGKDLHGLLVNDLANLKPGLTYKDYPDKSKEMKEVVRELIKRKIIK